MKALCAFVVDGDPVPKGRPRFARLGRSGMRIYTDRKTKNYEQHISLVSRLAMKGKPPTNLPVHVTVWCRYRKGRLDLDNVVKSCLDGMNGSVYLDDDQVVTLQAGKTKRRVGKPMTAISVLAYEPGDPGS